MTAEATDHPCSRLAEHVDTCRCLSASLALHLITYYMRTVRIRACPDRTVMAKPAFLMRTDKPPDLSHHLSLY
jgi:hypothetical protein